MANKRNLKKGIRFICSGIAAECLFSEEAEKIDEQKKAEIIIALASLQDDSISKISVSYDRCACDFDNAKEYNKARYIYFKNVYKTLTAQFNDSVNGIIKEMNSLKA